MSGPGDQTSAVDGRSHGDLRASHADRERVIGTLKAAFVQGMLAKDEFDIRVGQAFASRTYAELAAVTADLPVDPAAAQPPKPARAHAQPPANNSAKKSICIIIVVAVMFTAALWWAVFLTGGTAGAAAVFVTFFDLVALLVAGAQMIDTRRRKRSGRQLPPRPAPGAGREASQRSASAASVEQFPQIDHDQQHTAEAARSERAGPQSSGSRLPCDWCPRGHRYVIGYVMLPCIVLVGRHR